MDNYIKRVNEFNKFQLIELAIAQRKELIELSEELESQIQLNHNLIRISVERKNKERNIPAKEPGFRVVKWTETDQMASGSLVHCFRVKILTPYEAAAFSYRDIKLMMDDIIKNITALIGDFIVCQPNEVRTNICTYSETKWVWNITFEGDIERDRIFVNLFCSRPPKYT